MKTLPLFILSLLASPSAFAFPYSYPISIEEVGENFQDTLDRSIENAQSSCREHNDDFTYSCLLLRERSFEIRTEFVLIEREPSARYEMRTTVKGQFTCQCQMAW